MPYIVWDERGKIATTIPESLTPGHVNFILADIIDQWVGLLPNYERLNAAIGILECCKLEIYRRLVASYEDDKMVLNGDVFMDRS